MAASLFTWLVLLGATTFGTASQCVARLSSNSGRYSHVTEHTDLIFYDNFDTFDLSKWQHEMTLAGGNNWEFEWYDNNRSTSFVQDGILHIKPLLTADHLGEDFLRHGTISVDGGTPAQRCTNPSNYGCQRTGNPTNILNPIKSARIRTVESFRFKYGCVEIRAKMAAGDWLWSALWLQPLYNAYGGWPASGEIDMVEVRGNADYVLDGVNIGVEQVGATLHFGPDWLHNGYKAAHFVKNSSPGDGFHKDFHRYQMEWTNDYIKFSVDDIELGKVTPDKNGFWGLGNFSNAAPGIENPWRFSRSRMAPFDQEFYIVINLAVGGTNGYFPDNAVNFGGKPWKNTSPKAATDFWEGRSHWIPTWKMGENNGESSSLLVDYVKVWEI